MKAILDTISLIKMIATDGLKNNSLEETIQYTLEHFKHTEFENEFIKKQFEDLARTIIGLRNSFEYLK